jgi:hypothetical protein
MAYMVSPNLQISGLENASSSVRSGMDKKGTHRRLCSTPRQSGVCERECGNTNRGTEKESKAAANTGLFATHMGYTPGHNRYLTGITPSEHGAREEGRTGKDEG